jgi:DNA polymerase-3 subunit delta
MIGPAGEAEMRLARIAAGDLRRDPAQLADAARAQGFFPGPRVAFVEDATDGLAPVIEAAMADWRPGDAHLVVTAGQLAAKSALRKLFESHPAAHALGLYDDPPSREEIAAALTAAGLTDIDRAAMADLTALAQSLDPGDFRQTVEKIGLYKRGEAGPLTTADVAACAPASVEAEVDDIINAAANGQSALIGPLMRRLDGQGVGAVKVCMDATRHFRALQAAASDPGGPASGLARMRPPVFGPRRDAMQRQAQSLGLRRIEEALAMLIETDLTLRSSSRAPAEALMERTLIRVAMLARR